MREICRKSFYHLSKTLSLKSPCIWILEIWVQQSSNTWTNIKRKQSPTWISSRLQIWNDSSKNTQSSANCQETYRSTLHWSANWVDAYQKSSCCRSASWSRTLRATRTTTMISGYGSLCIRYMDLTTKFLFFSADRVYKRWLRTTVYQRTPKFDLYCYTLYDMRGCQTTKSSRSSICWTASVLVRRRAQ